MFSLLPFTLGAGQWVWHDLAVPIWMMCGLSLVLTICTAVFWRQASAKHDAIQRGAASKKISLVICWLSWGATLGLFNTNALVEQQLPSHLDGQSFPVTFQVVSLPQIKSSSVSFEAHILKTETAKDLDIPSDKRVLLNWYRPSADLELGQIWQGRLTLKRPRGLMNFGGFDYQAYLISRGYFAIAKPKGDITLVDKENLLGELRPRITEGMRNKQPTNERFFSALLIADKSGLTQDDWEVLQRTGTIHLMAISGLHIGIIALWSFWFFVGVARLLALCIPKYSLWFFRFVPPLGSIAGAFVYAGFADFTLPTIRALIACIVANVAIGLGRRVSVASMLSLCAAVIVIIQPMAFVDMGFWLSFSAVAILFVAFAHRAGTSRLALVHAQWVLMIGMLLPLFAFNVPTSLVGPLANLIAVPVVSVAVVPGLFIGCLADAIHPVLGAWTFTCIDWLFSWLWVFLAWLQSVPWASWWPATKLTVWGLVSLTLATVLILLPLGLRFRGLGVLLLIAVLASPTKNKQTVELTILDVGQGLSVVLKTSEFTWVYDTGPRLSQNFDAGSRIVAPYLRHLGVKKLGLIVSHDDNDHAGGAPFLTQNFEVNPYWAGEADTSVTEQDESCHAGQAWQGRAIQLQVLWPSKADIDLLEGNRSSCVVLVTIEQRKRDGSEEQFKMLLSGDIDRKVEQALLPILPSDIDLLVSPHHGSRTSSSQAFIERIQPRWVIHSAGFKHHYGHPHPQVVQRYHQVGATQLNTADNGAILVTVPLDGEDISIVSARVTAGKRWHSQTGDER